MMKINILQILTMLSLIIVSCTKQFDSQTHIPKQLNKQIPKVLIITTGIEGNKSVLPKGIVVAIQSLNRHGVVVRLETRDILLNTNELLKYNILLLSTSIGYHDADRQYSLSYMSKEEMNNIVNFVEQGGVLVAGDNVGRNTLDGTDRITIQSVLDKEIYPLASCFGLNLKEVNMAGYRIKGSLAGNTSEYILNKTTDYFYTLIPDSIHADSLQVLANWVNESDTIPAITQNDYGKGTAYLLASSDFLHPANDNGLSGSAEISDFYDGVIHHYMKRNKIAVQLNPWPNGYEYAFCLTMNAEGDKANYDRFLKLCKRKDISAIFFVSNRVDSAMMLYLKHKKVALQSNGFTFSNFRNMTYAQSVSDILMNEQIWGVPFDGFRFPYTMTAYWGLMALNQNKYSFETSIGANNLEFIHGSAVPHNIVISNNGFYTATDMLEIAPTYHDDYFYLKNIDADAKQPIQMQNQVALYDKYLQNFWQRAVKPYNGVMVYQGHPAYVAHNDTSILALANLIDTVRTTNTWITSISEIAEFRQNLSKLQFYVDKTAEEMVINVVGPTDANAKNVSIRINEKINEAHALKGNVKVLSSNQLVVFDASDGQQITIEFKHRN